MKGYKFFGYFTKISVVFAGSLVMAISLFFSSQARAEAEASEKGPGNAKFCVIVRPEVRDVTAVRMPEGAPFGKALSVKATNRHTSFFTGSVKKVGFGAPPCFSVNEEVQRNTVMAAAASHTDELAVRERMMEENARNDFFPTAGYFGRFSEGGRQALAVGLGVKSSTPDVLEDSSGTPQARAAVMFGFGF